MAWRRHIKESCMKRSCPTTPRSKNFDVCLGLLCARRHQLPKLENRSFFIGELTDDMVQLRRRRQSLNRQKASAIDERGWSEEGPTSQLLCPQHFLKGPTSRENLVQLVVDRPPQAKHRPSKIDQWRFQRNAWDIQATTCTMTWSC